MFVPDKIIVGKINPVADSKDKLWFVDSDIVFVPPSTLTLNKSLLALNTEKVFNASKEVGDVDIV